MILDPEKCYVVSDAASLRQIRDNNDDRMMDNIYLRSTEIFLKVFLHAIYRCQDDITAELTPIVVCNFRMLVSITTR